MFFLALFALYGVGKLMRPEDSSSKNELASHGDAAGGWGADHHHPVASKYSIPPVEASSTKQNNWHDTPVTHYHEEKQSSSQQQYSSSTSSYNKEHAELEIRESDLLMMLSPLVFVPSHSRPEYEKYQSDPKSLTGGESSYSEEILYNKQTPHGMAFDFMLNRDKRPVNVDDPHLIQRFVLILLFFATGGKESDPSVAVAAVAAGTDDALSDSPHRTSGWDSSVAHFLTGLHECHWVKKSLEDQFWGMLSIEGDTDRMVGVTKCNADMEVTELRLADLNLVGFIPEEIKWLSSLESFDMQNNHLAGPIPHSIGELDSLRYLSLDGNNFSGTIPDVFEELMSLERAYLNFNDFNGAMPPSLCTLREDGSLKDLWSDCGGYPITCTCCTVCCDMVAECNEMDSQREKGGL